MAEVSSEEPEAVERRRDKIGQYLQKSYNKGELALKHAIGLGAGQNVVPISEPSSDGPPRAVAVGWHPVGGFAGKWFAEQAGLGKMIKEKTNNYPDPTQHWAVLVGEYAHQLWMDEQFDIIYTNAKVDPKEWQTFQVGETRFNDDAVRRTGEAVIQDIRRTRPGYNLISNNCQTYVLRLLEAIRVSQVKEFGTTLAVYDRLIGAGKVADLFVDAEGNSHVVNADGTTEVVQGNGSSQIPGQPGMVYPVAGQEVGVIGETAGQQDMPYQHPDAMLQQSQPNASAAPQTSVSYAQHVMDANTTQLKPGEEAERRLGEHEHEHKSGGWGDKISLFSRKFKK